MAGSCCLENSRLSIEDHIIHLEGALDSIRKHFRYMKNYICSKDKEVQQLKEQLENVNGANQNRAIEGDKSLGRRQNTRMHDRDSINTVCDFTFADDPNSEYKFNMALDSEQLLDESSLSSSQNEGISALKINSSPCKVFQSGEKESPRKPLAVNLNRLCTPEAPGGSDNLGASLKMFSSDNQNNENVPPLKENQIHERKFDWRVKPNDCPIINNLNTKNLKKNNLSLNKRGNTKLKQTRLQIEVARTKSFSGAESTFCEDAIMPSPRTSSNQLKSSRSWILRPNFSGAKVKTANKEQSFSKLFKSPEKIKPSFERNRSVADQTSFELRADSPVKNALNCAEAIKKTSDNSSSIIWCTPASQELIFLEDSLDDTNIESMELLRELMHVDNNNLTNLKRIESEKVQQLQQKSLKSTKAKSIVSFNKKQESCNKDFKQTISVKKEKLSQNPINTTLDQNEPEDHSLRNESDDDFMVLPIKVKKEFTENMNDDFVVQPKKVKRALENETSVTRELNIKERFKIDCEQCQKYIDFLGGQLSDKEIEQHLSKCTRHKKNDVVKQQTPDDFWNPLLQSFVEDDPRNEVLIEERFVGKRHYL